MSETISDFLSWVDSFLNFEKTPVKNIFWLGTVEYFCKYFGNPEKKIPCYHVAGSKGKGSVCAFLSNILSAGGINTGVYSSPHISDFRERIRNSNDFFSPDVYEKSALELKNGFEKIKGNFPQDRKITWFELVTLYAFLCMKNAGVKEAVYEVGIGGRLDATNVITPEISIINTIELEHTEFLGNTITEIAGEKAGIIKEGIPVLVGRQTPEAKKVFIEKAKEKNSKIYFIDDLVKNINSTYEKGGMKISFESDLFKRKISTEIKLFGEFQAVNAAIASVAAKMIHPEITEEQIEKGLFNAMLPARFEIIKPASYKNIKAVVIDGAHTVNSINFTMNTFNSVFKNEKASLIFGCAEDKDVKHFAGCFKERFTEITITKPGHAKASDINKMNEAFDKEKIVHKVNEDFISAINNALINADKNHEVLLITGSFYLCAEAIKLIRE